MFSFILHGLRSWKNARGVALLSILALALGIGSTTAIYSVIQAVLLNPLGYRHQDRFLVVWKAFSTRPGWQSSFSVMDAADFSARARTLDMFGCFTASNFNVTHDGQSSRVFGLGAAPVLVNALGVKPALGRWFESGANPNVVVLSDALWRQLGANPAMVGGPLQMNGTPYRVLGVMPPWFHFPPQGTHVDLWVPLHPLGEQLTKRQYNYLFCIAQMKPGVTQTQAHSDLTRVTLELRHEYPDEYISDKITTRNILDEAVERIRPTLLLLLGAAGVLLLITCANVAGLLLARSVARARETAVRVALGAARWQLGLQYFTEGLLVSLAGAALGAVLSYSLVRIVIALAGGAIPRAEEVTVDWHVLLFALALAIGCGVLFSLAPLWQAQHTPPNEVLSDGTRASASSRSRQLLRVFVVAEIALAFGLLTASSLLLDQLGGLHRVQAGFDAEHLLTFRVFAPEAKFKTQELRSAYETKLIDAVRALPGVENVGFTQLLPLVSWGDNTTLDVEGRPVIPDFKAESIEVRYTSPEYFRTMRIPLIKGRFFTARDVHREPPATMGLIINRTVARLFWPGGNPIGAFVRVGRFEENRYQIIGVVEDVRNAGLLMPPRPELYLNYLEQPPEEMTWVVRSHSDEAALTRAITDAVMRVDRDQAPYKFLTMEAIREGSISRERLQSFMTSFFALAALLLAMLGVYGVVSYTVRQRTAEIGTRMAVGATSRDLLRLVMGDGFKMAAIGIALGGVVALGLTSALKASDVNIQVESVTPFLTPIVLLIGLTALACFFPAWRATLVSPMVAIRNEPGVMWQKTRWGILRVAEHLSGLVTRTDEQAASKEADLLAEIADVSRRATSFSEAIRAALECLGKSLGATSLALFVQRQTGEPYRCQGVIPGACPDAWMLPPDALIVSRLRNYPGALPIEAGELDAMHRWATESAPQHRPEIGLLRELGAAIAVRIAVKKEVSAVLFAGQHAGRAGYSALERRLLRGAAAQLAMMLGIRG